MQHFTPDISFILPIYKTPEKFLSKCVQSITNQTHTNIEIILVDDGSPDNCPSICDNFAKTDERITVIHQKNAGVGNARNTGLKTAKGEWVCFVDSDDWIDTTTASSIIREANEYYTRYNAHADVIMFNYIKEYGRVSTTMGSIKSKESVFTQENLQELQVLTLELTSNVANIWSKVYNKRFLIQNNFFLNTTLSFGEDIEYNVRVFQKITNALILPNHFYHYRYDENTASTAFNENYADYVKWFILALYTDVQHIKNDTVFLSPFYVRCVHTVFSLTVRYTFHKNNPHPYSKMKEQFLDFCSNKIIQDSIQNATYSSFSCARKLALFCLKHNFFLGLYLIAKIRQIQYNVKQ